MLQKILTLLIIVWLCAISIKGNAADGFRGGKIEYRFKTNDSIEILLTVYTTCEAQAGGGVSGVYFGAQKLYVDETTDTLVEYLPLCNYYLTPNVCPDTVSRCSQTGGFKLIYTSMVFEYKKMIPLSRFSNCKLTFFWQGEGTNGPNPGRSAANTTGHSATMPYLYAFADYCTINTPNSPIFSAQFHDAILWADDLFFNYGITVDEPLDDSVYFEFITPLTTNGATANYSGQWTKNRPISFLGFPNNNHPAPGGIQVDGHCGYVKFRPIKQNEVTNFAVKVTRYVKRWGNVYKVSEVMYEHEVWVYPQSLFQYFFPIPKIVGPNTCIGKSLYPPIVCNENKPRREPEKLICTNDSILITTHYDTSYRYQWNKNGNPVSGATKNTYWATDSGLYTVDVLNNQTGCFKTSTETRVTIFDGEKPKITTDSVFRYCKGDTAYIKRETRHYNWLLWKINGQPYTNDTAYTFKATQSGTYTLDVVNKQGCRVSSAPLQITVSNADTTGLFTEKTLSFCGDFTDTLRATKPLNVYNWLGATHPADSFLVINTGGKYHLLGKDTNNCPIADSVTVYKHPLPVVTLGADTSVCYNAPINKNLWATGAYHPTYQYNWNNNPTDTLHTHTATDSGTYFVQLVDSNRCSTTDSIVIKRFTKTTVSLGPDTGFCYNTPFSHTYAATPTPVNGYKYLWNNNPADTLHTYTATDSGLFFINLADSNNCPSSDSVTVAYYPQTKINLGADTAVCYPVSINRTLMATPGYQPAYKYIWNNNPADTLNTHTVNAHGVYFVEITDNNRCKNYDSITFTRYPQIQLNLGPDTTLCNTPEYTLNAGAGFVSYLWSVGSIGNPAAITINSAGTYWVIVNDTNNCKATDSVWVAFEQQPQITLADTVLCEEDFITLEVPNQYNTYLWSNGSTTFTSDIKDTGAIWVRVANVCGQAQASAWIRGCRYGPPEIYIPNAFTPNGDGFNNVFKVYAENIRTFNIKIFNRWGELIFQSDDAQQGWDGTFAGKPVPQDVYVYVISTMGKNRKLNTYFGSLTLLR